MTNEPIMKHIERSFLEMDENNFEYGIQGFYLHMYNGELLICNGEDDIIYTKESSPALLELARTHWRMLCQQPTHNGCCPMCGTPGTGKLD